MVIMFTKLCSKRVSCSSASGLASQHNILSTCSLDAHQTGALKQVKLPHAGTLEIKKGGCILEGGILAGDYIVGRSSQNLPRKLATEMQ